MLTWIYRLSKDQLATRLGAHGIDSTGNIETLRKRLRQFVIQNPGRLNELKDEEMPGHEEEPPAGLRTAPEAERPDPATILNQIRKWGLHFEGKDPFAFLERLEELTRAYGYSDDWLLLGLPELLRGDPLLWYRNNREAWHTWAEFCQGFRLQYLPPGYRSQIKREIQGRRQQPGESFSKYATTLLTLMRRAGGFTAQEQTEQLYENLDPEYQLYIRPAEATSVTELSARAAEYERIAQRRRER